MSDFKHAYFIAKGRALEAILVWKAKRDAAFAAYGDFFRKAGIVETCHDSRGVVMFRTKEDAEPKIQGFRVAKGNRPSQLWVFDRKTQEGKALAKEWDAIDLPGLWALHVGTPEIIDSTMHLRIATPEPVGEVWVLRVPYQGENAPVPYDSTLIKTSEYWAMKEAAEPAKADA